MTPFGEYNLTDDECVVISAPATVLPLRLTAPGEVMEAVPFTIEVTSEDLDENGNVVSEPGDMVSLMEVGRAIHSGPAEEVFDAEPPRRGCDALIGRKWTYNAGVHKFIQSMNEPEKPYSSNAILAEISGSMGNFGTVLPIVLGAALVSEVDLGPALLFFGLWYIVMGLHYGIPMSVEPMKAIGAIAIAEELTSGEIAASGMILGAALFALGLFRGFERLQSLIPESVVRGVQLGLGLVLLRTALVFIGQDPLFSAISIGIVLLFLVAKSLIGIPDLSTLVVFAVGIGYGIFTLGAPEIQTFSIDLLPFPDLADFLWSGWHLVFPQIPLTLTNATVATALTAQDLFKKRIEPDHLCVTMGLMNLVSVPFGGFPLCHGAGGLAAHRRFGAETGLATVIGGIILLFVAFFFAGPEALDLLPIGLFGALLLFVALELARCGLKTDAPLLTGSMALIALFTNVGLAFLFGIFMAEAKKRRVRSNQK
jgi:hypothetical protein